MDIESIKQLIKNGDFPQAHDQLRQILSRTPDDAVAQMLYGTCCQIMGDSGTFGRIYQRLAPQMERCVKHGERSERTAMWIKYAAMFAMIFTFGFHGCCTEETPTSPEDNGGSEVLPSVTSREGQGEKDALGLYQRVLKMPLKKKFRYFLERQDVKDQLYKGEGRIVLIPIQFNSWQREYLPRTEEDLDEGLFLKWWGAPEREGQANLLLIRVKGDLETIAEVRNSLKSMSEKRIEESPFLTIFSPFEGIAVAGSEKINQDRGRRSRRVVYPFQVISTSASENRFMLVGTFAGLKKAIQCVVGHGDMSDLLVSSDESGYLVLGVCFVNVHGSMARTLYGGPRDYGDRFPKRVMTPQGKMIYELTEEMVRKQMEEARKPWEGISERPSQLDSRPAPVPHTKYGGPSFNGDF